LFIPDFHNEKYLEESMDHTSQAFFQGIFGHKTVVHQSVLCSWKSPHVENIDSVAGIEI
jgi:hypothetical protein